MRKYLLLFSVVVLGLSACKKGDIVADQAAVDDAKIQAFIAANYKTTNFIKDPSGLYYTIIKAGTGPYPTTASTIKVSYTGKYLNGSVFEIRASVSFALSSTIEGWQIGIPHINSGTPGVPGTEGRILLIIPSALAYGPTQTQDIPPNSPLIYTIDLLGVSN